MAGINGALKEIPPDAAVSASGLLLPHLAFREKIYYYPAVNDAEYICANVEGDTWPLSVADYQARMDTITRDPLWEVIYRGHNMVVLRTRNPHEGFYIVPGR